MEEKLNKALYMYTNIESITLKQISEKLDIPIKSIKEHLLDNGVKIEKRGYIPNLFIYLEIMELYKTGNYSLNQLSKIYNIDYRPLSKYFKKCGIEIEKFPHKKKCNTRNFENINTEEKAYWLGFLYADGCVSSNRNTIELCLCVEDKHHLEKFKNFMDSEHSIGFHHGKLGDSYRISIRDNDLKNDLIKAGCVPNKSLILKFPSEDIITTELIRHFIRGYFDGDGCLCKTENTEYIDMIGTMEFLQKIQSILNNIGIKSSICPLATKNRQSNNYRLILSNKKSRRDFLNYIYKDTSIYLDRKYKKYLKYN